MTEIELMLERDRKKLLQLYTRANTKSKMRDIINDLFSFSYIESEYFDHDVEEEWENDINLLSLFTDSMSSFLGKIKMNSSFYKRSFESVINSFIEYEFNNYKNYYYFYQRLTQREMKEIIFEFLNSYDSKLAKRFLTKLDDTQIFETTQDKGVTFVLDGLNKNLVFFNRLFGYNIDTASTIVHELGHDYEMNIFGGTGRKRYLDIVKNTPYYEISSSFFEYAFKKYLEENRIFTCDVNACLHSYLSDLLILSYEINVLNSMKEFKLDELNRVSIENETVSMYAKWLQEKINYYDLAGNVGDSINYKDAYIYGIGKLYSIYLYEAYKSNPNEFKKEFRNALINYPTIGGIEAFANLGITEDVLVKGDTLKRVLKNLK